MTVSHLSCACRSCPCVLICCEICCRKLRAVNQQHWQHPSKGLQLVVSNLSKKGFGLLGGSWDPVDGGHPEHDSQALINTAVRTFKASTGLDLAACTEW